MPEQTLLQIKAENERRLVRWKWVFVGRAKCKFCKYDIDWWKNRKGRLMPMNSANLERHWIGCTNAFKQPKPGEKQASKLIKNSYGSRAYMGLSRRR
jgi:hypothetical protein